MLCTLTVVVLLLRLVGVQGAGTVGTADVGVDAAVHLAWAGRAGDGKDSRISLAGRGVLAVSLSRGF